MDRRVEILDLADDARELVRDCEIAGQRTVFTRNGREVAILLSHDEYLALRETIEITGDEALRELMRLAEEEVARGALLAMEDLLELNEEQGTRNAEQG
jgi:PHD/YefM family antitoxin component YafN of YafNO toxin-antitoxin module